MIAVVNVAKVVTGIVFAAIVATFEIGYSTSYSFFLLSILDLGTFEEIQKRCLIKLIYSKTAFALYNETKNSLP
jgi:hypothetical protein